MDVRIHEHVTSLIYLMQYGSGELECFLFEDEDVRTLLPLLLCPKPCIRFTVFLTKVRFT